MVFRTLCTALNSLLRSDCFPTPHSAATPPSGAICSKGSRKSSVDRYRRTGCSRRDRNCSRIPVSGRLPVSVAPVSCGEANRPAYVQCFVQICLSVLLSAMQKAATVFRDCSCIADSKLSCDVGIQELVVLIGDKPIIRPRDLINPLLDRPRGL